MNAMCHLQHVEAEGLVLRAEHTQLRHALHRPGNSIYTLAYIRTYTRPRRMHTRAHVQHEWRARARVYAPSLGPIRPLVKASMRARDTCTTCPCNKLSMDVVSRNIAYVRHRKIFEHNKTFFFLSIYHFILLIIYAVNRTLNSFMYLILRCLNFYFLLLDFYYFFIEFMQ